MSESFRIGGKKMPLSAKASSSGANTLKWTRRPGGWLVYESADGARGRIMIHEARGQLSFATGGKLFAGTIVSESRHGRAQGGADSDLVAQFPGKVRKILIQAGAEVEEGAPLVLVEAMKMEFSIKAPSRGKIAKILVSEGQQLSPGDRFVEFEAAANGG